ncbi:MAG: thiamine phosphate synthase [archaeon]|nr:thiamine phosphate synthase [archaeon]
MTNNYVNYKLYLVTDRTNKTDEEFLNIIEEAIKGGVTVVQIREKDADTLEFYNISNKVKEICSKYNVPLIINDRIDIALAIDANGVHIGQSDMPIKIARKLIGNDKILGISAHNLEEATDAEENGADYLGVGAIFSTSTKKDANDVSIDTLKEITSNVDIPTVAIGGINLDNVEKLKDTNISGISVVSAIMNAENPKIASENLLRKIKN